MQEAAFTVSNGTFVPAPWARSSWGKAVLHGAPIAGLLARAVERFAGSHELAVARLTRYRPDTSLSVKKRSPAANFRERMSFRSA